MAKRGSYEKSERMDLAEEIRNLKEQVQILSNLLWEIKLELDRKRRKDMWYKDAWEDYK